MRKTISLDEALELLKKYNKEPFHIHHGITVANVMGCFAENEGFESEKEYWQVVGMLHDIDFELYPDEHCLKAPELLKDAGVSDDVIHAVCSHGYGITVDIAPEHMMEKFFTPATN